jgi:pimeloyl-ACP methyl ester carboxylesterase
MVQMSEAFEIEIGGATLPGVIAGEGVPVVFLHAGVCDHRMWDAQVEAAAEAGFSAIAYDRRGYGEAVSPDEPFNHLEDLEAVLDDLGVHAAVVVGCSMGGGLAIDFALKNPGRTIGLVLVGTSMTGAPPPDTLDVEMPLVMAEEDAEERGDLGMLNKVHAHAWLDGPRSPNGRVEGPPRELFFDMNAKALGKPALTQEEKRPPALGRLDGVNAPALLVVGDLDFNYLIQRHEDISEALPNAFAVVLEGTAHLPNLERADLFNPLLLQFLEAVAGSDD